MTAAYSEPEGKRLRHSAQKERENLFMDTTSYKWQLRLNFGQPVTIEVLSNDPAIADRRLTGTVHKHLNEILTLLT